MTTDTPSTTGSSFLNRDAGNATILIVDDHPIVRHGLAQLIDDTTGLEVCEKASNAADALDAIRKHQPDVAVIDISLGGGNGLELIKQVKAEGSQTKMLVSSMHDELLYAERALRAGAMGYINKSEGTDRIIEAIRQILTGRIYLSGPITERVLQRMMRNDGRAGDSPIDTLSDRELEVFEMIGQGKTTKQIAKSLHLSPKTIETHREHIKTKLNLENNNELVRHAVQWVLENG
ncbi:response regulator [Phycisphaerales bacterium AB-hyl4]|uniref:Response regulator n=1 Tax=Natronomicrosphaera hydrolytica TaxID=3242702 RepID=A0ABV4U9I8_9BACT